jgi:hypothetical protein
VQRDEQNLAARPKKRPSEPGDDMLASEVIKRQEAAFEEETKSRRESLAALKDQAKAERKQLESFRR